MRHHAPLLTELLKAVSRSFYLTLRMLPRSVRPQIGLAYLLARTTDTIADTELVPVERRLAALNLFRARIAGADTAFAPALFQDLAGMQRTEVCDATNAERILLERAEEVVSLLDSFSGEDQRLIREVLSIIVGGQELDLERFGNARAEMIVSLRADEELDDYTYRVAGCVGEFWTNMCRTHVLPRARLDDATLLRDGVRFGKGLQLVNILRDLPRDLKRGRCYFPLERLARVQLKPNDLLNPRSIETLRPVYNDLLDVADAHLAAGWCYTNSLPRSVVRIRLACAWPILIGAKTLARLRRENPLDAERRVKVSRQEVKKLIGATMLRYPFPGAWQRLFEQAQIQT